MKNPQQSALDYAAALDRTFANDPDYLLETARVEIGDLLGGESIEGFKADLLTHLSQIEEEMVEEASPSDYRHGRGGNDPEFYISDRLLDEMARTQDRAAEEWLLAAQRIMAPHEAQPMAEAA